MVRRDADQLRPRVVVAAVDNESMNGANPENCDNAGLNANVHSIATIRHTAESFADGVNSASTQMILCPARAEFGDREGWTKTTLKAATATIEMTDITLTSEQATELARIKAASGDLLTVSKTRDLQWPEVMKAVWDMKKGGKAPAEFLERAPFMITVQGQNRAAVFIMALADDLGARVKRAGQFGYEDLFPDDGGCGANLAKLKKALMDDNAFLPATICDHLTYRESTEMGRRQHKAEKHSRKTGLYSAVEMGAMIVRQAFCPESNGCKNILREVLGDDWEREWKSSDKDAKRLQAGLAAHIKNDVVDTRTSMYRGAAVETLVYAHGLERHFIVDVIMERLLKEDEAMIAAATSCNDESDDEAQRKKSGKRGCSNFRVEVLAALFGLMEPNQRTPELVQRISDAGIVSGLGELIKQLGRNGIVQRLVRSALERQHLDQPREDDKGIFLDAIPDLVSVEDAAALGAENGNGLREAEQLALKLFVRCFQKGSLLPAQKKKWLTTINKRCLNNYLNSSNQTEVCPGRDKQPVLSVSCTPITFYRRTLLEYEHSEDIRPYKEDESKGRDGRRLSIELTALVVDRVIRRLAEGDDAKQERALDNFKKIVAALDRNGWLFAALSNKPEGLTVGAEALFDSPRQEIINKAVKAWPSAQHAKATGGGSSKKDAAAEDDDQEVDDDDDAAQVDRKRGATGFGSVLLRHGDKVIEISLPPATLQELGLGDEARTDEEEEVSVVLVKRPASDKGLPLTKRAKKGGFKMAGDPPASSHGPNSEEEAASAGSIGKQGAKPNVVKKGEDFSSEDSDQLSSQGSHQGDHSDFFEDDEFPLDSGSLAAIKNVKDILGECKKQFGIGKSPKEGGSSFPAAKEGVVNDFFKERLPKSCYANLNAAKSIRESANSTTVYAFLPSVVEALGSRLVSKEHHPCPRPPRRSAVAESVGGTDVSSDVGRKASEKGKGKAKAKAKGNGAQAPGLKGGKKTPAEPARGKKGASKKSFSSKEWKEGCETEEVAPESKDPDDDQVGCGVDGARDSGGGDVMCLDDANAEKAFTRQSPAKEGAHVTVKLPSSTKKRQGDRQDCGRASGSGVAFPLSSTQQKIGGGEHVDVEVEQSVASMPSTAVGTVENVEGGTVGGGSGAGGGEKAGRGRPIGGKASLAERAEAAKINQRFFELQMQYHAQRVAMGKEGISDAAFEATMAGCRVDLD